MALEWGSGAEIEYRTLIVGPRIKRSCDIDCDRTEGRLPAQAEADCRLQIVQTPRLVQEKCVARVEKGRAADSKRRPNRESGLAAQEQFLAAADLLNLERHALLIEGRNLWTQRIELVAADIALATETAWKKIVHTAAIRRRCCHRGWCRRRKWHRSPQPIRQTLDS